MIFPRKPEACPLLTVNFLQGSCFLWLHLSPWNNWRRDNALNRIVMSKVHSVPQKQIKDGRRVWGVICANILFQEGNSGVIFFQNLKSSPGSSRYLLPGISRQQTIFFSDLRFFVPWFHGSIVNLWMQRFVVSGFLKQVLSCHACLSLRSNPPFCFALM